MDSEESSNEEEDENGGQPTSDTTDQKLISFKSPNLLNQMLPYAGKQEAPAVPDKVGIKRKAEQNLDEVEGATKRKRVAEPGYGGFLKE